jgi:hypothetical protein
VLMNFSSGQSDGRGFLEYWESLGFFENIKSVLPPDFFVLFDIARIMFSEETNDAFNAIEEISKEEKVYQPDRDETIQVNRMEKIAPVGDRMELGFYKKITELKKSPPRELAQDDEVFDIKLFTKTLMVQKFYESEADSFKPVSTSRNESGKDANRFEQKFYILLDRSRSMDMKMRSFYSKCIVAEFLRKKMKSKAKLFFRAFDSSTGELFKTEKIEDFPKLIEHVLFTTTGGASTNLQAAVIQAVNDIEFDKDSTKAEILVVTDGISKIEKNELKLKLRSIKLNILKIGSDPPEPDYFELEAHLKAENIAVDPSMLNIKMVQQKMARADGKAGSPLSSVETRVYRTICDHSEKIFKDLKDISNKYIEIGDLKTDGLYDVSEETVENLRSSLNRFSSLDFGSLQSDEKVRIYKQVNFIIQYLSMLIENGNKDNQTLNSLYNSFVTLKSSLMKDPDIIFTIVKVKDLKEDKKTMKLAKKEMKKLLQDMQMDSKNLTIEDMKRADMFFNMDPGGDGNMGKFILLLMIKLAQFVKKVVAYPFNRISASRKKDESQD